MSAFEDIEKAMQKFGDTFTEFRKANDERVEALEKGERVGEAETKLAAVEAALEKTETAIDAMVKAQARAAASGEVKSEDQRAHEEGLMKFIRKGDERGLEELEEKAVNLGTDSEGGFALTDEMDTNIGGLVRDFNPMRGVCKVMRVGNETYSKLYNQGGAASGWVGETDARPETGSPTLSKVAPSFGEIYANPAVTQKALDDMFFDAAAWLQSEVAEEFGEQENLAFTSGDGTNKPRGILDYTFAATPAFGQIKKIVGSASGTLAADDFIDLFHAIKAGYRGNGSFMLSDDTIRIARKLKDGQGNYLWQQSFAAGTPSTILARPVVENHDMPSVAAGANAVLFGDFNRAYTILDVRGTRVLRDPYTNKPYVHFYTTKRVGGGLMDSRALCAMEIAA